MAKVFWAADYYVLLQWNVRPATVGTYVPLQWDVRSAMVGRNSRT